MSFDLKTALASIAPTLATMLGGPLVGTAVAALEQCFGLAPGAGQDGITKVIQAGGMTPDIIAAVRAADQRHAEVMGQQGIDLLKLNADHEAAMASIEAGDRDSARKREGVVGGITTPALAWSVVGGSVVVGILIAVGVVNPQDVQQATLVGTVLGYLFGEAKQVLSYYFGSSLGSERKTELLAKAPPVANSGP